MISFDKVYYMVHFKK